MEENKPEAQAASGGISAPQNASAADNVIGTPGVPKAVTAAPFTASKREKIAAFAIYALAYVYILIFLDPDITYTVGTTTIGHVDAALRIYLPVFTLGFAALVEWLHHDTPCSRESRVWLGCVAVILCSIVLERGNAWDVGLPFLFLHIFAVWWALSRSNTLLEGESGHLLPLDALDGFFGFPFKHFFLRIRTVGFALSHLRGEEKKKAKPETILWTLGALAAAIVLLIKAASLLMDADSGFNDLLSGVAKRFWFEWNIDAAEITVRFLLSLPVGAYLFGLLAGSGREDRAALDKRAASFLDTLATLRKVPNSVWTLLTALFCLLYLAFFAVQGQYLFGAFTRTLPADFSVSEYARRGFFELCKVMAVNFALLWLVTRSSKVEAGGQRASRILCLVLLAESFLLAVVAFSKLALYIDCFGFTPKRLQSTWLVCVLAFGCGCAAWSLVKNTKTFRVWMYFGAVTLSLLCLY